MFKKKKATLKIYQYPPNILPHWPQPARYQFGRSIYEVVFTFVSMSFFPPVVWTFQTETFVRKHLNKNLSEHLSNMGILKFEQP